MKIAVNKATLIKRYKRFLADVKLDDGTVTTIHVANTGAMTGCADPGDIVWYSTSTNKKRKYPMSWELTEKPNGDLICVNTIRANQFIEQALLNQRIKELSGFNSLKREVSYGEEKSKIDFLLSTDKPADNSGNTYVEVKSATLLQENQGYFPDAVTIRGQKHLRELSEMSKSGHRAVLLFAILHSGIHSVTIARHIDNDYGQAFDLALKSGVQVIEFKVDLLAHYQFIDSCSILREGFATSL
ncbi:sugar fermentation stimulation protein [Thalassotalea insulae]|uniref:Sugar fermentation stimulation protein homolog n=1 Tax=Thalassotalea insulae TaxID=2056778 RepID=A0ABQ6GXU6_9GAMM|nr:DNA/RNA nuclease SfsA [Thalassotalea insulae]GLX79011.1 sugar fermentation stimulation protein [Thalassotalea insulae]